MSESRQDGAAFPAHARKASIEWQHRAQRQPSRAAAAVLGDVRGRMVREGWARGEARVAEDSDFESLKTLLASQDGWSLEYAKDCINVWTENAAHGALRTVKVHSLAIPQEQ